MLQDGPELGPSKCRATGAVSAPSVSQIPLLALEFPSPQQPGANEQRAMDVLMGPSGLSWDEGAWDMDNVHWGRWDESIPRGHG